MNYPRTPVPLPISTHIFPTLTSTNAWLREQRHRLTDTTLCVAIDQTHGIGQRGNAWTSLPGDAAFSIYIPHLRIPATQFFSLSQIAALATALWIMQHNAHPQIKWPNDILINSKKIAGILIETFTANRHIQSVIIGIGLNIAHRAPSQMQFPYPITTLANETGQIPHAPTCARCIAHRILALLYTPTRLAMHRIPHRYHQLLYRRDLPTRFQDANGQFLGRITRVAPDGRLCIRTDQAIDRTYAFKEVQMLHDPPLTQP